MTTKMNDIDTAITLIQRAIRAAGIVGDAKHIRFLRTALYVLRQYKLKIDEQYNQSMGEIK